jgi:hypothetical protein
VKSWILVVNLSNKSFHVKLLSIQTAVANVIFQGQVESQQMMLVKKEEKEINAGYF